MSAVGLRRVGWVVGAVAAIVLVGVLYLLFWPVVIDPLAWRAPVAPPLDGRWAPNTALREVYRYPLPEGDHGPEDIHVWKGQLVGGTAAGRIVSWPLDGGQATVLAETGGRPLGLHPAPDGALIIADATRGLVRLSVDGELTVLCERAVDGSPLVFADDLDVASDGTIWFSDASTRFGQGDWKLDLLESRPNGRLLRWRPNGRGCEVMLDQLYFANGVALAADERFVLVNETSRYRVRRLWIAGPRRGEHEVLIDNLPGFPDGISRGEGGVFWIALASPRNPIVDGLSGSPHGRRAIVRLPKVLQPAPARHPFVVAIDADGTVLGTLQDPDGRSFGMVTSAEQHNLYLYLGSLAEPAAARVELPGADFWTR